MRACEQLTWWDGDGKGRNENRYQDGFRSVPIPRRTCAQKVQAKKNKQESHEEGNPLIHTLPDESASMKSAQ